MGEHVDQGVEAELVDLAAEEIVEPCLSDPDPLRCFSLS